MYLYYVYIISNQSNSILYIGVTNNLDRRISEHKLKLVKGFSCKYNLSKLLYFEEFNDIRYAIGREKQLKKWKREWKYDLIKLMNPTLNDLSGDSWSSQE